MNLTEMITQTRIFIDDRSADRFPDSEVISLINVGQEDVQKQIDELDRLFFSAVETFSIAAHSDAYEMTLPTDCRLVTHVEVVQDGVGLPCTYVDFRRRHDGASVLPGVAASSGYGNASDLKFYIRGQSIGFVSPSQAFTIRLWYTKRLPRLSIGADVSEIPREFHTLVCLCAAKLCYGSVNEQFPGDLAERWVQGMNDVQAYLRNRQSHGANYMKYEDS